MSTIVSQTLSNGTVSTSTANVIQGSAKAWVNYAGSSGTRNSSYNVSSVTRSATGRWTVNFTTAFANTSYCVAISGVMQGNGLPNQVTELDRTTTTLSIQALTYNAAAFIDPLSVSATIFST
jgi:hypothetical protein